MERVVIVDDEMLTRLYLREILESNDFDVVGEAGDGLDAVTVCRKLHPDFIILDINMPVMNGLEAARIITNEKLAGFVMLLTAYRDREITEKISSLDVMGYLVKPVDEYSLIPAIRIALNKYHQLAHIEQEYAKTKEALDGRKYLDRAKGMIMDTQHLSEHDAYAYLRKLAMDKGLSLTELSRLLLQAHNE